MSLHKIPNAQEQRQHELQAQAAFVNTRFNLSSSFLNTLLGRSDADVNDPETIQALVVLSVSCADALMLEAGLMVKAKQGA